MVTGLPSQLTALSQKIYSDNVERGWWLKGSDGKVLPRNVGELLCLIHSEIDEADTEGFDDKLPHRKGFEVELADVVIRVLDMLGHYGTDCDAFHHPSVLHHLNHVQRHSWLLGMHKTTSEAMEHFRKKRPERGCELLVFLLGQVEACALAFGLDLTNAIYEKLDYNAVRADHKIENRQAAGGKSF